jgi:Protein of unknown function (DUF2577)
VIGSIHKNGDYREGSGAAQLAHVISKFGHNVELEMRYATVLAPLPSIKIKMDGSGLVLDYDDVVVLEHLRQRTEEMIIKGQTELVTVKSPL